MYPSGVYYIRKPRCMPLSQWHSIARQGGIRFGSQLYSELLPRESVDARLLNPAVISNTSSGQEDDVYAASNGRDMQKRQKKKRQSDSTQVNLAAAAAVYEPKTLYLNYSSHHDVNDEDKKSHSLKTDEKGVEDLEFGKRDTVFADANQKSSKTEQSIAQKAAKYLPSSLTSLNTENSYVPPINPLPVITTSSTNGTSSSLMSSFLTPSKSGNSYIPPINPLPVITNSSSDGTSSSSLLSSSFTPSNSGNSYVHPVNYIPVITDYSSDGTSSSSLLSSSLTPSNSGNSYVPPITPLPVITNSSSDGTSSSSLLSSSLTPLPIKPYTIASLVDGYDSSLNSPSNLPNSDNTIKSNNVIQDEILKKREDAAEMVQAAERTASRILENADLELKKKTNQLIELQNDENKLQELNSKAIKVSQESLRQQKIALDSKQQDIIREATDNLNKAKKIEEDSNSKLTEVNQKIAKIELQKTQLETELNSKLSNCENEIKKLKDVNSDLELNIEKNQNLLSEQNDNNKAIETLETTLSETKTKIDELKKENADLEKHNSEITDKNNKLQTMNQTLNELITSHETEQTQLNNEITILKEECAKLKQSFETLRAENKESENELKTTLSEKENKINQLETELTSKLSNCETENKSLIDQVNILRNEKLELFTQNKELNQLKNENEDLIISLKEKNANLTEEYFKEKIEIEERAKSNLLEKENQIKELQNKNAELENHNTKIFGDNQNLQTNNETLKKLVTSKETEKTKLNDEITKLKENAEKRERDIKTLQAKNEKRENELKTGNDLLNKSNEKLKEECAKAQQSFKTCEENLDKNIKIYVTYVNELVKEFRNVFTFLGEDANSENIQLLNSIEDNINQPNEDRPEFNDFTKLFEGVKTILKAKDEQKETEYESKVKSIIKESNNNVPIEQKFKYVMDALTKRLNIEKEPILKEKKNLEKDLANSEKSKNDQFEQFTKIIISIKDSFKTFPNQIGFETMNLENISSLSEQIKDKVTSIETIKKKRDMATQTLKDLTHKNDRYKKNLKIMKKFCDDLATSFTKVIQSLPIGENFSEKKGVNLEKIKELQTYINSLTNLEQKINANQSFDEPNIDIFNLSDFVIELIQEYVKKCDNEKKNIEKCTKFVIGLVQEFKKVFNNLGENDESDNIKLLEEIKKMTGSPNLNNLSVGVKTIFDNNVERSKNEYIKKFEEIINNPTKEEDEESFKEVHQILKPAYVDKMLQKDAEIQNLTTELQNLTTELQKINQKNESAEKIVYAILKDLFSLDKKKTYELSNIIHNDSAINTNYKQAIKNIEEHNNALEEKNYELTTQLENQKTSNDSIVLKNEEMQKELEALKEKLIIKNHHNTNLFNALKIFFDELCTFAKVDKLDFKENTTEDEMIKKEQEAYTKITIDFKELQNKNNELTKENSNLHKLNTELRSKVNDQFDFTQKIKLLTAQNNLLQENNKKLKFLLIGLYQSFAKEFIEEDFIKLVIEELSSTKIENNFELIEKGFNDVLTKYTEIYKKSIEEITIVSTILSKIAIAISSNKEVVMLEKKYKNDIILYVQYLTELIEERALQIMKEAEETQSKLNEEKKILTQMVQYTGNHNEQQESPLMVEDKDIVLYSEKVLSKIKEQSENYTELISKSRKSLKEYSYSFMDSADQMALDSSTYDELSPAEIIERIETTLSSAVKLNAQRDYELQSIIRTWNDLNLVNIKTQPNNYESLILHMNTVKENLLTETNTVYTIISNIASTAKLDVHMIDKYSNDYPFLPYFTKVGQTFKKYLSTLAKQKDRLIQTHEQQINIIIDLWVNCNLSSESKNVANYKTLISDITNLPQILSNLAIKFNESIQLLVSKLESNSEHTAISTYSTDISMQEFMNNVTIFVNTRVYNIFSELQNSEKHCTTQLLNCNNELSMKGYHYPHPGLESSFVHSNKRKRRGVDERIEIPLSNQFKDKQSVEINKDSMDETQSSHNTVFRNTQSGGSPSQAEYVKGWKIQ